MCSTSAPVTSAFWSTTRRGAFTSPPGNCSTCGGMGRRWSRRSISISWRITGTRGAGLGGCDGQQRSRQPDRLALGCAGIHAGSCRLQRGPAGSGDPRGRGVPDRHGLARAASTRSRCRPMGAGSRWASASWPASWTSGSSSSTGGRSPGSRSADRTGDRPGRPTGARSAFIHDSATTSVVYARPADGSTPQRLLARLDRQVQEVTWSPDGRWLLMRTDNGTAGLGDIVGIRTSGDTTPVALVEDNFTELQPAVSPDGRWLAYTSNESGAQEVYVRSFPGTTGGRWQVSNGGGIQPRWSSDGRELYFKSANRLIAARVETARGFEVTELTPLLSTSDYLDDGLSRVVRGAPGRPRLPVQPASVAGPGVRGADGGGGGELVRRGAAADDALEA